MEALTNEQLCALAQNGDVEARNQIIENNIRYIQHSASSFISDPDWNPILVCCGIETDDLVQVGSMSLLDAIDNYDAARGTKFLTYAGKVIRNAFVDLIKSLRKDNVWRLTRNKSCPQELVNLDDPINEAGEETVGDMTASLFAKLPEQICIERETKEEVLKAMEPLPTREKVFICYRYSFEDGKEHPLTETASHFRLTQSRARSLEKSAIKMIKHELLVAMPERALAEAENRLTKLLVQQNDLHAVELRLKSVKKRRKKTAAAVYEYLADCDGKWGELNIDYENSTVDVRWLADWDTIVSHRFAARAADWFGEHPGGDPPERIILTFISPDQMTGRF